MRTLLLLFVLANLADVGTTLMLPLGPGGEGEANPIARYAYILAGPLGMTAFKLVATAAIMWTIHTRISPTRPRPAVGLLSFGVGVYGTVAVYNYQLYLVVQEILK